MQKAVAFFVHHPKIVQLLMAFVFLAGLSTLGSMRYEYNPKVDMGVVNITTGRLGSGPEDIELSITMPLEEELLKVEGIEKIYSNSMEALSVITLRLDADSDNKNQLLADIQKAVDRGTARLPADLLEKPLVEEQSTLITPVMELHIVGDVSEDQLRRAARKITEGLREVEGVAGAKKLAYRRKEVKVFLDPAKLDKLGISIGEISRAITERNLRDSGGSLNSFTTQKKVLSAGQFAYPKEIETVILRSYELGDVVRIKDVATVIEDYEDWQIASRTDGQRSIILQVRKKSRADELHTAANVRAFAESMQQQMPAGIKLIQVNDISRLTVQMLDVLVGNALLGVVLVLAILYLLLNRQLAFWVAMGLPFAIILTFLILYFIDVTINAISLTAIILMMGILVDDAVVVGESIQRQRENGLNAIDASIAGTMRVSKPVIFAVITTMLAFMPLLGMSGADGEFMRDFPIAVVIILAASIFESQFILPAHLAHANYGKETDKNRLLQRFGERYQALMQTMVRRRGLSLLAFVLVFVAVLIYGALAIRFHLYPAVDIDNINIKIELPAGSSFEQTRQKVIELEGLLGDVVEARDLQNIIAQIGHHDTDFYGATEGRNEAWALIVVQLKTLSEREVDTHQLVELIRQKLKPVQGLRSLIVEPQTDIPVVGKPVELEVVGNSEARYQVANQLLDYLRAQPSVVETWTSFKPGKDIIDLAFNHQLLAARGLTVGEVIDAVRVAMDGLIVDDLQTLDERIYYRLQFPPAAQGRLASLENLSIINQRGEKIYLKTLVDFNLRAGDADIKHYQGRRTVTVYADIDRDNSSVEAINQQLANWIAEQPWADQYPDIRIWQGGELEQQQAAMGSMSQAFTICILSIFVALVLLFNSYSQPLLVLICIPFGLIGVIVGFGLQGLAMGFVAMTGVIGLAGVLVNDSLVMLHTLNHLRDEKGRMLTDDEIAFAASYRFRPIVITSLTTVAGLFPTAYGIAGSNSYISPMVMAMAWGVMFGLFITLLLLPCLYGLDQDSKRLLARLRKTVSRER